MAHVYGPLAEVLQGHSLTRGMRPVLDQVSYLLSEDDALHTNTAEPFGVSSRTTPNVQQIVAV